MSRIMLERSRNVKPFFCGPIEGFIERNQRAYNRNRQPTDTAPKHIIEPHKGRNQLMTIAAGFECKDGIVICADRQMSHGDSSITGGFSHYEKKVFGAYGQQFVALACGAGDGEIMKPITEAFFESLISSEPDMEELDFGQIRSILEATLKSNAQDLNYPLNLDLITVVMFGDGRRSFMRTHGLITEVVQGVEIAGIGDMSLIRYLIDSVYKPEMSLVELTVLATCVIWAAKKYCPQYCGGNTDVWASKRGSLTWNEVEASDVARIERIFEKDGVRKLTALLCKASAIPAFADSIWH